MRIGARVLAGGLALPTVVVAIVLATIPRSGNDFGDWNPGQHVYDRAGALRSGQLAALEAAARSVERAGAPTVVYLQAKAADAGTTQRDATDLMHAWHVESVQGAGDGLVVLLDLHPGDLHHGSAALVSGQTHVGDGALSGQRLQAISDGAMRPRLAAGDVAGAILAALDQAGTDLTAPAPAGPPLDASTLPDLTGSANLFLVVLAAFTGGLGVLLLVGLVWIARGCGDF